MKPFFITTPGLLPWMALVYKFVSNDYISEFLTTCYAFKNVKHFSFLGYVLLCICLQIFSGLTTKY